MKSGHSHPPGLRQRLLLWILLPLIVVFTGSILFDYRLAQETANTAYDHSLNDAALDITAYVQTTGLNPELRLTPEAEAMLRSDAMDKIFFAIHGADQQLLAGDADLPIYPGSLHERPTFVDDIYRDEEIRATTHRIVINGDEITITVAETMRERNHASHRILAAIAFPNLMIIVATLLVIYFGVRRGLAPLYTFKTRLPAAHHAICVHSILSMLRAKSAQCLPGSMSCLNHCAWLPQPSNVFWLMQHTSCARR